MCFSGPKLGLNCLGSNINFLIPCYIWCWPSRVSVENVTAIVYVEFIFREVRIRCHYVLIYKIFQLESFCLHKSKG